MKRVLVVTGNAKKLGEILEIMGGVDLAFDTLAAFPAIDIVESGETFFDNALIKARTAAEAFGVVSLGEDSGLVVDALDGRPGVHSRRFSGPDATDERNNRYLLELMKHIPQDRRTARFVSTVVVYRPDGSYIWADGAVEGVIGFEPRGEKGFGYDPLFCVPSLGRTFAELDNSEKNSFSHRKRALEKISLRIREFVGAP